MKNLGYLECQRGGYHTGQFLNIICLQSSCKSNILCCCACIEQLHQNHRTKTLKKLLIQADSLFKDYKQPSKAKQITQTRSCNTDIMSHMVQNEQKQTMCKFYQLKKKFINQIDHLENNLLTYYKSLNTEINKSHEESGTDIKTSLAEGMELVQGSSSVQSLKNNVSKLMRAVNNAQRVNGKSEIQFQKPDQESYLNYLKNSNNQINDIIGTKFKDLHTKLQNQNEKLKKIMPRISKFWNNQLYKFSNILHHSSIDVLNPFSIRATQDSVYQVAVMDPPLSFTNDFQTFRFRINVNDLDWVGVGVCYKNIIQKNNFEFKFQGLEHGCYMISGNAGTWSHSDADFNNSVKGFYFKQGDSVTCSVYKDRICFIKDIPAEHQFSEQYSQRQYFELLIRPEDKDNLHPCVVAYYKNTEVEYLPSFNSQLSQEDMPVYKYKFSPKCKHQDTVIINDSHIYGCQSTQYKCCVLDSPIQDNGLYNQIKEVSFRVTRSTGNWIGLGLCHKNILNSKNYDLAYGSIGHGCYMISANGGSWSHSDSEYNNIVKTFKFIEGELITIQLDQQNKKILFKKSIDTYQLPYQPINGDKLYPVVVLYYPDDEVQVLPHF